MTHALRPSVTLGTRCLPVLAVLVALALGGCSATGPSAAEPSAAPVTEFDEPEQRKRARLRLELASAYFEQGQMDVALDELKQSLAADPTYATAHVLQGRVLMQMNNPRAAEDSFQRALQHAPRDPYALHHYGWFQCRQGRHAQAIELFDRALASPVYGGQAITYTTKGVCQLLMGQRSEAQGSFSRAYELDPGNPIAAFNLSQLLFQRGEDARAQFIIRRLNNSELANAETLWLGIKIERRMGNSVVVEQLAQQLGRRFADSSQWGSYQRGAFHE